MSLSLAAVILTKNEERDLPACLESLQGLASEVFVIDSRSTDRTVEIARGHGARVIYHEFVNQADQFNWALKNIRTRADWILRIDADERVSPMLRSWFGETLPRLSPEVTGVSLPLRIRFLGHDIRWGDSYPVWLLRVFRRGCGRCEDTWMDERIILSRGKVVKAQGDLIHEIPKSLAEWSKKHIWYAERECKDILTARNGSTIRQLNGPAGAKRALKEKLYLRLPPFFRAFAYWFYRYFLRLGFLDGKEGLIYHFLQAFWYRFLVDARLYELSREPSSAPAVEIKTKDAAARL